MDRKSSKTKPPPPPESDAAEAEKEATTPEPEAPVVVVLRPGWAHDPYRMAGGLVIPSDTPTEVDAATSSYLLSTFPDGFTVKK